MPRRSTAFARRAFAFFTVALVSGCSVILGLGDLSDRSPTVTEDGSIPGVLEDGASPLTDGSSSDGAIVDGQSDAGLGTDASKDASSGDGGFDGGPLGGLEQRLGLGTNHVCFALADKTVKCWGKNDENALGSAIGAMSSTPVAVPGVSDSTQISAAGNSACVRLSTGMTSCWGGQNGGYPPSNVSNVVTVSVAGGLRACALYVNGTVGCWGANGNLQLGGVQGGPVAGVSGASSMHASDASGYAIVNGKIFGWGGNQYAQLGLGDVAPAQTGTAIELPAPAGFTQVSGGGTYACGVSAGVIYCWGGDNTDRSVLGTNEAMPVNVPHAIALTPAITDFIEVSTSHLHACARTASGDVYCWGSNNLGRLGVNNTALGGVSAPLKVTTFGVGTVAGPVMEIHTGFGNTCVRTNTQVYCWGVGTEGQGGDGSYVNHYAPVMVSL